MPQKRLLIVAPCLADAKGHLLSYLRGIAIANQTAGNAVTVLAHATFDPAWIPEATVLPYFERRWEDAFFVPERKGRILSCLRHNLWIFRKLRTFLKADNQWDTIFCAYTNVFELVGWRLACFWIRKRTFLLINTPVPIWVFEYYSGSLQFKRQAPLVLRVYRSFASMVKTKRCAFSAETDHDAKVLSEWTGYSVSSLPTPRPQLLLDAFNAKRVEGARENPTPGFKTRLGWLGRADEGKGFDLFTRALALFQNTQESAKATIVIQWFPATGLDPTWRTQIEALQTRGLAVEWIEGALQTAGYGQALAQIDFLILPYKKVEYIGRNSSAAVDAFSCGVPIIATEGTWMAEKMEEWGAGISFPDGDAGGLCDAMQRAVQKRGQIIEQARKNIPRTLQACSWDELMKILWPQR